MLDRSNYHTGQTQAEQHAAFNCCSDVFIFRDGDCNLSGAPLRWFVHYGNSETTSGWQAGAESYATRGAALAYAKAEFPSFPIYRAFLQRIDGKTGRTPLYMPRVELRALERSDWPLLTDSQDIKAALTYASRSAMRVAGIEAADVSGIVEIPATDERGETVDIRAIYATVYRRPFELASIYVRIL